jgi:oxalate decarboxylase/phosphoglucose isomerase-like protein (cupin superfamily)
MTENQPVSTEVPAYSFEWGMSRWLISPATHETSLTFGEAWLPPGDGHGRHNHPNSEEILFVLSGEGEQMIDDREPFAIRPGDVVHVPVAVFHATFATSWEPLRLLVIHAPAGAEEALRTVEGFREIPAGNIQKWGRKNVAEGKVATASPNAPTPVG